jgi:hypothetical protein
MPVGASVHGTARSARRIFDQAIRRAGREHLAPQREWTEKDYESLKSMSVREILTDDYFFGKVGGKDLFSPHMADIEELWERRKTEGVSLYIDQEGIGSGKTTKAAALSALLLLEILTTPDLRATFNANKDIVILTMSRKEKQSREVTFSTILPFCCAPAIIEHFPPNIRPEDINADQKVFVRYPKSIRFPGRVHIFPATKEVFDPLGYDIYAGTVDEANYLEVVAGSKREYGAQGRFDAAEIAFSEIFSRIKSRFSLHGRVYGLLHMISNSRYKGDFFDRTITLVERGELEKEPLLPPTMVTTRCTWQTVPASKFSDRFFYFDTSTMRIVGIDPEGGGKENGRAAESDDRSWAGVTGKPRIKRGEIAARGRGKSKGGDEAVGGSRVKRTGRSKRKGRRSGSRVGTNKVAARRVKVVKVTDRDSSGRFCSKGKEA